MPAFNGSGNGSGNGFGNGSGWALGELPPVDPG